MQTVFPEQHDLYRRHEWRRLCVEGEHSDAGCAESAQRSCVHYVYHTAGWTDCNRGERTQVGIHDRNYFLGLPIITVKHRVVKTCL